MPQTQALSPTDDARDQSGSGVALIGVQGHIEWANPELAIQLGISSDALVDMPLADLAQTAPWLLGDTAVSVGAHWLRPERVAAGDKTLLIVHDVTELQRLREENAALRLTDELTGLPNRRAITQALELQISRSRRYGNPLAIALAHLTVADGQVELVGDSADQLVLAVSRFLRDRLRWVDQIGRWEDDLFLLVLPETSREDAELLAAKIRKELEGLRLPAPLDGLRPHLAMGIGTWNKGDDLRTLLRHASRELAVA